MKLQDRTFQTNLVIKYGLNNKLGSYGSKNNEFSSGITKDFARILKEIRFEKKLTQHDLTNRSGISLRMISDMERGIRQPSLITLFKLAKGFDMPVFTFMKRLLKDMGER
jgi:DNA-binding XRE family transcriptional regulator